ncbi:MAG TPA: hypothetical protein VKU41_07335 [Polyangiaceae bacterium]|nr:hypothetical protein [Polyangiaceae bacterium]
MNRTVRVAALAVALAGWGCGPSAATTRDAGREGEDAEPGASPEGSPPPEASSGGDAAPSQPLEAATDALEGSEAGGVDAAEGGALPADRFVTGVVSFTPGPCAGFGAAQMPGIVEGPPVGGGTDRGSTDVVSLGSAGSIVVSFAPNGITDGPGPDFIVFENPFWVGGNSSEVYAEPGEVSVSDDGSTWHTYPCASTPDPQSSLGTGVTGPYGQCAGWHIVWSNPQNGISPFDPSAAGGDPFDLADLGVTHARYVRIVDKTAEACPDSGMRPDTNGFDLDAVSIVHADIP